MRGPAQEGRIMKQERAFFYAGMEAGGTKFVCMVASGPDEVRAQTSFPTTKPEETLGRAVSFFKAHEPFAALGIGTFGPCNLNPASPCIRLPQHLDQARVETGKHAGRLPPDL